MTDVEKSCNLCHWTVCLAKKDGSQGYTKYVYTNMPNQPVVTDESGSINECVWFPLQLRVREERKKYAQAERQDEIDQNRYDGVKSNDSWGNGSTE